MEDKQEQRTAIGYVRVSTRKQELRGMSLENQPVEIKEYCNKEGIKLIKIYSEQKSAKNINDRPEFKKVIKDFKNGIANSLIVANISRPFRSLKDAINTLYDLNEIGVNIISIREKIDTSIKIHKSLFYFNSVFAEIERDLTKERTEDIMQYKANRGLNVGKIPNGYKASGKGKPLKIDEKEAEKIKDIFDLTIKGINYKEICNKYDLQFKSYYNIIRNQFYLGKIKYNGEIYQGIHEPIINQETFDNASSKIKRRINLNDLNDKEN